ncbi:MAG: cytoplasmic protein [Nitrospirota bacterium]
MNRNNSFINRANQLNRQFESLGASLLYCPKCRKATPTRERLLLILPDGNLYDYLCEYCGTSTGERTEKSIKEDAKIYL